MIKSGECFSAFLFSMRIECMNEKIIYPTPGPYSHYKGGIYEVLGMAIHTETDEKMVVYRSLTFGTVYVRPLTQWFEQVESGEPRFLRLPNIVSESKLIK